MSAVQSPGLVKTRTDISLKEHIFLHANSLEVLLSIKVLWWLPDKHFIRAQQHEHWATRNNNIQDVRKVFE